MIRRGHDGMPNGVSRPSHGQNGTLKLQISALRVA